MQKRKSRRIKVKLESPETFMNTPKIEVQDMTEGVKLKRGVDIDARCCMLGAGALRRPRGKVWGGRREEGSGWGTHVYLWRIHFDIWKK